MVRLTAMANHSTTIQIMGIVNSLRMLWTSKVTTREDLAGDGRGRIHEGVDDEAENRG